MSRTPFVGHRSRRRVGVLVPILIAMCLFDARGQSSSIEWAVRSIGAMPPGVGAPAATIIGGVELVLHHGSFARRFEIPGGALLQTLGHAGSRFATSAGWSISPDAAFAVRPGDTLVIVDTRTGAVTGRFRSARGRTLRFFSGGRFFESGGDLHRLPGGELLRSNPFTTYTRMHIDDSGQLVQLPEMLVDYRRQRGLDPYVTTHYPGVLAAMKPQGFADGNRLVVAFDGRRIQTWSTDTVRLMRTIQGAWAGSSGGTIVMRQGGRRALTLSSGSRLDSTMVCWDLVSGEKVGEFRLTDMVLPVIAAAIAPDERTAIIVGGEGDLRTVDLSSGRSSVVPTMPPVAQDVAASPDGSTIATVDEWGRMRLVDAASGRLLASVALPGYQTGTSYSLVPELHFSPDGRRIAAVTYPDSAVHVWDARSGAPLRTFPTTFRTRAIAWSPDGRALAVAPQGLRSILLLDPESGQVRSRIDSLYASVVGLCFTPDGRSIIASLYYGATLSTIARWDLADGALVVAHNSGGLSRMLDVDAAGNAYYFGDVATALAMAGRDTAQRVLVDLAYTPRSIDVSDDGRWALVTGIPGPIAVGFDLYDLRTGTLVRRFSDPSAIGSIAGLPNGYQTSYDVSFAGDGRHIVSASSDGDVIYWRAPWTAPVAPPVRPDREGDAGTRD